MFALLVEAGALNGFVNPCPADLQSMVCQTDVAITRTANKMAVQLIEDRKRVSQFLGPLS